MYTIDLMDVIMFFVLLVIFAFFALLVETLFVGYKNDKVNGIEKNMKVKKYGGKYHSGVREVNTSGKQTVKDVQQKTMELKKREYMKVEREATEKEKCDQDELVKVSPEKVKDGLYNSLMGIFEMLDATKHQLSSTYEGVTNDLDIFVTNYKSEVRREVRREVCNEIIRALNTCDRYVADSITHCETGNKYLKNEVFVVDDIYEIVEDVMKEETKEDGID